eukprot:CAMPEP_0173456246 /NCGR_PEP_ID=MMETSP1357-20121228/55694_1 /TAXON_ID=77926 /ORGANISM="Hemiselmis rufescens, Strain PCC563" /LENGTH=224 /DNA_ID=CAMNT_0014423443 /DNA_START=73 /DNA_END=744 /DNA_ORIENTATION=+
MKNPGTPPCPSLSVSQNPRTGRQTDNGTELNSPPSKKPSGPGPGSGSPSCFPARSSSDKSSTPPHLQGSLELPIASFRRRGAPSRLTLTGDPSPASRPSCASFPVLLAALLALLLGQLVPAAHNGPHSFRVLPDAHLVQLPCQPFLLGLELSGPLPGLLGLLPLLHLVLRGRDGGVALPLRCRLLLRVLGKEGGREDEGEACERDVCRVADLEVVEPVEDVDQG